MARTPGFGSPKPGLGCLRHFFAPDVEKCWSTRRRGSVTRRSDTFRLLRYAPGEASGWVVTRSPHTWRTPRAQYANQDRRLLWKVARSCLDSSSDNRRAHCVGRTHSVGGSLVHSCGVRGDPVPGVAAADALETGSGELSAAARRRKERADHLCQGGRIAWRDQCASN